MYMAESFLTPEMPDSPPLGDVTAPEALQTPTRPKSLGFQLLFGLANMVVGLCSLTIFQALLPSQVASLDAAHKVSLVALISAGGALGAVIANPLAGALSDRTISRWGRRRPWIVGGVLGAVIALALMAQATTIVQLAIGGVLLQVMMNVVLAGLTAIIPDQVPVRQRATVSAFAGMAPLVGGVVGLAILSQIKATQATYATLAGLSILLLLLFLLVLRDPPVARGATPPMRLGTFLAHFWVNPLKYPDFRYTFLARCLVFLGYTSTVIYTFFFLQDAVHYEQVFPGQTVAQGVAIFQAIVVGSLIISAIVSGILSDRLQRRKIFVIVASIVMGVALLILALFPLWLVVLGAAGILGIGFGIYLSVDLALASQVLPAARDRGKDLGIINTAIFIPLIVAPAIAAAISLDTSHNYTAFFLIASCATFLAVVLIVPIKGVR